MFLLVSTSWLRHALMTYSIVSTIRPRAKIRKRVARVSTHIFSLYHQRLNVYIYLGAGGGCYFHFKIVVYRRFFGIILLTAPFIFTVKVQIRRDIIFFFLSGRHIYNIAVYDAEHMGFTVRIIVVQNRVSSIVRHMSVLKTCSKNKLIVYMHIITSLLHINREGDEGGER